MAGRFNTKEYGVFTQILRRGLALSLCTTLLPFTQMDLLAQSSSPQQYPQQAEQSGQQYPYQDPADPAYQQQPAQPGGYDQGNSQQGQYGNGSQGSYDGSASSYIPQSPQQLEQLVAPIALYPDSLVAQVLAGSTFPQQVQEAENWMRQYGNEPAEELAQSVNAMPWDPSVKALTQFPSVLQQMARSDQWTSALGNAYYNQPADVMSAVQSMRYRAREAGQLRDTPQQVVVDQGPEIVIQPVNPEVVYVPYYNPWAVYGEPVPVYYGFYEPPPPPGLFFAEGIGIGFGFGIGIAAFGNYGWGCHHWAPNWRSDTIIVNNNTYISNSTTVINHGGYAAYNQGFGRGGPQNFQHAAFNARAPLYNGRPIGPENRPVDRHVVTAMNRPGINTGVQNGFNGGVSRGGQQGIFNRPVQAGTVNRPGQFGPTPARPGQFGNPGQQQLNRPAPNNGFNRPFQPGQPVQSGQLPAQPGQFNRAPQGSQFNRPVQAGGFNGQGQARPAMPGQFNRPAMPSQFNRAPQPTQFSRPAQSFNRPAPPMGGGFNRPATPAYNQGGGSFSRSPAVAYNRAPAPMPSFSRPSGGGSYGGGFGGSRPPAQSAPRASFGGGGGGGQAFHAQPQPQHMGGGGGGGQPHGGGEHHR